jgi:hypothetical protein
MAVQLVFDSRPEIPTAPVQNPRMLPWNLSGLGLRATCGRKPRQVRKEATVVV